LKIIAHPTARQQCGRCKNRFNCYYSGATPYAPVVGANAIVTMRAALLVGGFGFAGAGTQGGNVSEAVGAVSSAAFSLPIAVPKIGGVPEMLIFHTVALVITEYGFVQDCVFYTQVFY